MDILQKIKLRCGIVSGVTVYDEEIRDYIKDCQEDMVASGVPPDMVNEECEQVCTAVSLYVKAYLGNDRTDTDKYLELYRRKIFRLTLEEGGT